MRQINAPPSALAVGHLILLVLMAVLAGCGNTPDRIISTFDPSSPPVDPTENPTASCADRAVAYKKQMEPLRTAFDETLKAAKSAAPIDLAGRIGMLQEIRREAGAVAVAACIASTHDQLLTGMDMTIESLVDYLSEAADVNVTASRLVAAQDQVALYDANLTKLISGERVP